MKAQTDKTQESQNSITPKVASEPSDRGTAQLMDNRTSTIHQRNLKNTMNATPSNDNNPIQRKASPERPALSGAEGSRRGNNTGLPDTLKSGIENLSGYSMDDVKVHYNSSKPAQLQAHAYAQGTDIHLAPGQEKHLPHEAWHVVQQKQGRVKPTRQLKSKVSINDDAGLEKEADVMGGKAQQVHTNNHLGLLSKQSKSSVLQREEDLEENTLTINLEFAGSGKNEMNNEGSKNDLGWRQENQVFIKESVNNNERLKNFIIAGPRAPITKTKGMNPLLAKSSWLVPQKLVPRGSFDLGSNKITNVKNKIPEFVQDIITNSDCDIIRVNIIGHSRGAVAAAYVAELISNLVIENKEVEVSYIGYDPVAASRPFRNWTIPTDLSNVNNSVVIYSTGAGSKGLMVPKPLNPKVIIITSAQHSANKSGTFFLRGKTYSKEDLYKIPDGVYHESLHEDVHMMENGELGGDGAYGMLVLEEIDNYLIFERIYEFLKNRNEGAKDKGRDEVVKKVVREYFNA